MNNDNVKLEIVGEFKHFQIRESIPLFSAEGEQVGENYHRSVLLCGDFGGAAERNLTETANIWWTQARQDAYQARLVEVVEEPAQ